MTRPFLVVVPARERRLIDSDLDRVGEGAIYIKHFLLRLVERLHSGIQIRGLNDGLTRYQRAQLILRLVEFRSGRSDRSSDAS